MKRIAILSDTHGLLREEVKEELRLADIILHAGDINSQKIVDEITAFAPLYVVRGNNDKEWAEHIPKTCTVTIEGITFFLVHNKKDIPDELTGVDLIIFGHSHKYEENEYQGIPTLNPGSCGKRRFDLELSMCRMIVENGSYQIEKIVLPHHKK